MPSPDNKYIICPVCGGEGKNKYGLACSNCAGMGLGTYRGERFFYWGPKLGRAVIELARLKKKFDFAVNVAAFLAGLVGLLSLGWWLYRTSEGVFGPADPAFWREKDRLLLVFWLSILADMFFVYRLSEAERRRHRIGGADYSAAAGKGSAGGWEYLKKTRAKFRVDVAGGFGEAAFSVIERAYGLAAGFGHSQVLPVHLFFSCLGDGQVAAIFSRLDIDLDKLAEKIKDYLGRAGQNGGGTRLAAATKELLVEAYLSASRLGQKEVTAKNLIIPCLDKDKTLSEILYDFEIDKDKIFNVILWFIVNDKLIENYRAYRKMARFKPGSNMDRAYTAVATPNLSHYGYDLTAAAKWGKLDFCVARDEEIGKIWHNFESGRNGVILAGPSGVGKSAVVGGVAALMVREDVPKFLRDKRMVELDVARLVSGATPAQAEERLLTVIDEIVRSGNIVLYIDNIENIMGITSGTEESLDLSEVLAGAIERKRFYCLASITAENYVKYAEGRPLANAMAKVEIGEPAGNQAIQIVESKIGYFEGKYKVYFSYNAIEHVIELSKKYIRDKYLPQKAIDILELVAVKVAKDGGKDAVVAKEDIAGAIHEMTGIPVTKITAAEGQNLLKLEERIHERMIDQEEAVRMVAASLRRARTQLREGKRPIANFLFLGPTGVGKTELAKTVADIYFGNQKYMVRIDMSEYQHPDSVTKMIGDASGIRGYLTEAVRRSPFSLVLLDEIEKAHPDILNLFLQVMDDGRLTDGSGRTIDFTNSIVIATSNAGAVFIQDEIRAGTDIEKIKDALVNEHLNKVMRPELINRFDGVIVFKPLSLEDVAKITRLMLNRIAATLKEKGIGLRASEEGAKRLARLGFDPKFGARPLRRLLQERVEDGIANRLLSGELKRRDTVVIGDDAEIGVEKGRKI